MGNLNRGARHIIVPSLSAKDFGVYTATSRNNMKTLLYRGFEGPITFPGVDADTNTPFLRRAMFGVGKESMKASRLLEFIAPAPCSDCNYEAGLSIGKDVNYNGELFDSYDEMKYYYGHLPSIQSTIEGELADADKLEILGQIIEMINYDRKAVVNASLAWIVTNDPTTASTISINGNSVALPGSGLLADEINASTADIGVLAYKIEDDDTAVLVSQEPGFIPVTEGADTEILSFYLKLDDRYENQKVKINWELDIRKWDAISHIHLFEIAYSGADDVVGDIDITIDETVYSGTDAGGTDLDTTVAAVATALTAASDNIGISQNTTDGTISIAVINGNEVTVTEGSSNALTFAITQSFGIFQEETLTGEWLRNNHFGHEAGTVPAQPVVQPEPDAKYVMLMIELKAPMYNNVSPDVMQLDQRCYYFYMKETDLLLNHWSDTAMMADEPAVGDIDANLFTLLKEWVGSRPDGGSALPDLDALDESWFLNHV